MAGRPILILHGWSDHASSFTNLKNALAGAMNTDVSVIDLGDYLTLDDEVTYEDLVEKLGVAWDKIQLPRTPGAVDVVVHSTGGLVIRDWLSLKYKFDPQQAPIKHLVMLAPANFGSPLAHQGWSFIGRLFRGSEDAGRKSEVGKRLLKGLEMGSPYSWQLAMRDRFGSEVFYDKGRILCTVIVGNRGYGGLSGMVNKNGSDGTVYVSTANMNCALLKVDFATNANNPTAGPITDPPVVDGAPWPGPLLSNGRTAFCIHEGANHKTITLKEDPPHKDQHLKRIVDALRVTDDGFYAWCDQLDTVTANAMANATANGAKDRYVHGFQNTVVRLHDQYGHGVADFTMEFFQKDLDDPTDRFAEQFHQQAIDTVHPWSDDNSYRSLIADCTMIHEKIDKPKEALHVSLTAEPQLAPPGRPVGYRTYTDAEIKALQIPTEQINLLFRENRTLLADLTILRLQDDSIFLIHQ